MPVTGGKAGSRPYRDEEGSSSEEEELGTRGFMVPYSDNPKGRVVQRSN